MGSTMPNTVTQEVSWSATFQSQQQGEMFLWCNCWDEDGFQIKLNGYVNWIGLLLPLWGEEGSLWGAALQILSDCEKGRKSLILFSLFDRCQTKMSLILGRFHDFTLHLFLIFVILNSGGIFRCFFAKTMAQSIETWIRSGLKVSEASKREVNLRLLALS